MIANYLEIEEQIGYTVDTQSGEIQAPCGCSACDDGVQPGHFACEQPPAALLQAERDGLVTRHYDNGAWRWFAR